MWLEAPSAKDFTSSDASSSLLSEPESRLTLQMVYKLGNTLLLRIQGSCDFPVDNDGHVHAEIIKVFEPTTLSPVMEVLIDNRDESGMKSKVILKLYDRRFNPSLRKDFKTPSWNAGRERILEQAVVHEPKWVAQRGSHFDEDKDETEDNEDGQDEDNNDEEESPDVDWDIAEDEAWLHFDCLKLCDNETTVYNRLQALQGTDVPKLLDSIRIAMDKPKEPVPPEHMHYFEVPGIILEHIDGFNLEVLQDRVPRERWPEICEKAIRIVNRVSDHDIKNKDVRPENFLVCSTTLRGWTMYEVVQIDFALCHFQFDGQTDDDWAEEKFHQDEEGAIGVVMQDRLKRLAGGGFTYTSSNKYDGPWAYDETWGLSPEQIEELGLCRNVQEDHE